MPKLTEAWLWNCPAPIAHGEQSDEEGFGTAWVLCRRITDEQAEQVAYALNMTEYHNGAGRGFARRPVIRHTKWHTFIYQRFGLDI